MGRDFAQVDLQGFTETKKVTAGTIQLYVPPVTILEPLQKLCL